MFSKGKGWWECSVARKPRRTVKDQVGKEERRYNRNTRPFWSKFCPVVMERASRVCASEMMEMSRLSVPHSSLVAHHSPTAADSTPRLGGHSDRRNTVCCALTSVAETIDLEIYTLSASPDRRTSDESLAEKVVHTAQCLERFHAQRRDAGFFRSS